MEEAIINRVANSGLISIDLEHYVDKADRIVIDIKDQLFQGMVLREKDFRAYVKEHDWAVYKGMNVAVTCSTDAIIPTWAYMLLVSKLQGLAEEVVVGDSDDLEKILVSKAFDKIDFSQFKEKKIVIKGCSTLKVPEYMFGEFTKRLLPYAASIMYGEPCSTVPVYKKPKASK